MTGKEEAALREGEERLRAEAERIIVMKDLGIPQQTIGKMVDIFSISKKMYDKMKERFERRDVGAERGVNCRNQSPKQRE